MAPTGKARALADYVQSSIADNRNLDHKVMNSFSKEPSGWAQVRSFVSRRSRELASLASKPLVEVPEAERPAPLAVRKIPSRTVDNAGDISPISEPDSINYIPWDPRMSVTSLDTTTSRESTDSAHIETASYVPYARFQRRDVQVLGGDSSPVSTRSARTVGPAQMQNSELDSVLLMGYAAQRRRQIPNALRPGAEPLSPSSIDEKPEEEEEEDKEPEEPTIPEAVRIAQAMLEGEIPPIATSAADDNESSRSSISSLPTIILTHPSTKQTTTTRPRSDHPALLLRHKRSNPRLRDPKNRPQTWTSNSTRLRRLNGPLPPTPYEMAIELGLLGEEDPRPSDQDDCSSPATPATPATVASDCSRISSGRYSTMTTSSNRSGNSVGSRSSDGSIITIPRRPLGHRDFRPVASRISGAWGPDDVGTGETGVGGDEVRLTWVDAPASPGSAGGSGSGTRVRTPQQWLEQFRPLSFDELNVGCLKEEEEEQTLRRRRALMGKKGKGLWRRSEP